MAGFPKDHTRHPETVDPPTEKVRNVLKIRLIVKVAALNDE